MVHFYNNSTSVGDMNTNMLKSEKESVLTRAAKNMCNLFDMKQIINEPTRVTDACSSLIDVILVSDRDKIANSGVISMGISDHMLIFCTRKVTKQQIGRHNTQKIRCTRNYTADEFRSRLSLLNWSSVTDSSDVENAWNNFKVLFLTVLESVAPIKEVRLKQRSEPWFSDEILKSINERDKALLDFKRSKDQSIFLLFKMLRNKTQRLIDKAKRSYLKDQLEEHKNCSKKLWKCLKEIGTGKTRHAKASNIGLNVNGITTFDKLSVATCFNKFFTTVAKNLVDKLPSPSGKFGASHIKKYYEDREVVPNSFSLHDVSQNEIFKALNGIERNKATGLDSLPARFVCDAASVIDYPTFLPYCKSINFTG